MKFAQWLEGEVGRSTSLADRFGVSRSAVSQWKANGVPVRFMKTVRDLSGGVVTLDEMLPDAAPLAPIAEPATAKA